jgi:hypothetical protein
MLRQLGSFRFTSGYRGTSPKLVGDADSMSDGSQNVLVTGSGKNEIFKGITVKPGVVGSQKLMNVDSSYGGLGDHTEEGLGSVFRVLAAIFFIGVGKLYFNGVYLSDSATTTLSLKTISGGAFSATFQAGSAEPSAPTIAAIAPPSGYTGKNNGTVSVRLARFRSTTGAISNASPSSNVAQASNQSIQVTFPSADTNGQDYWKVYGTKNAEGGLGNSFYLQDIAESVIAASISVSTVSAAATTVGVPNGTLTASNIGWQYTSAGDTTTYVTAVGANDSYAAGRQTITLNAATVLTTTQSATFTRAVAGVTRTYVFEWRDADLEPDFAPIRNYAPPAGKFAGTSQDVVWIDGVYGDSANVSTQTDSQTGSAYDADNVGNAIAISDANTPESFPPDNYIFTGTAPTCILNGGNGIFWRFSRNSLGVLRYVGGQPALEYSQIWAGIGVANQNNAALGQGGRLYAFTGSRSLVRVGQGGEPDSLFSTPIQKDIEMWTDAVLGYDGKNQVLCVMNGMTVHAFYEPLNVWCSPITLSVSGLTSASIKAAVTINDRMYLAIQGVLAGVTAIRLYDFNIGSGSTGIVRTSWIKSQDISDVVARISSAMRVDATNTVTVKVYCNGDDTTVRRQFTHTPTAGNVSADFFHLPELKPSVRQAKSWRIEMSYTSNGGDAGFEGIDLQGESSGVTF